MIHLEQALQTRWAEDASLSEWFPPQKVWTLTADSRRVPRVEILCCGEERAWLTPQAEFLERVRTTFTLWHESYGILRQAVDRVKAVFDRATFDLGDGARLIRLAYHSQDLARDARGCWKGEVSFTGLAVRPVAVTG